MTPQPTPEVLARAQELRESIDRALAARNRADAVALALAAVRDGGIGVADLYTLVIGPLLVDTGAAWQSGETAVWEEHYASATVRTIIEALYPDVVAAAESVPASGITVVLACPPQEQHDLALRMLADRFTLAGHNAVFLGADTPTVEIVDATRTLGAKLVVLSAATHFNRVVLRRVVDELAERLPGVRLAVGGPAFMRDADGYAGLLLDPAEFDLPGATLPAEEG